MFLQIDSIVGILQRSSREYLKGLPDHSFPFKEHCLSLALGIKFFEISIPEISIPPKGSVPEISIPKIEPNINVMKGIPIHSCPHLDFLVLSGCASNADVVRGFFPESVKHFIRCRWNQLVHIFTVGTGSIALAHWGNLNGCRAVTTRRMWKHAQKTYKTVDWPNNVFFCARLDSNYTKVLTASNKDKALVMMKRFIEDHCGSGVAQMAHKPRNYSLYANKIFTTKELEIQKMPIV